MRTRLAAAIKFDIQFQFRHGFYYAYLFVSALYIVLLRSLPEAWREIALTLIIFTDTSVLGFFFIGGLVLLEKGQRTLESLVITPLRIYEYFAAKVISLTLLSLVMTTAIILAGGVIPPRPLPLFASLTLSSILFILIGMIFAARTNTVNEYLITAALYTTVLFLPVLDYLGVWKSPIFYIFPTQSSLLLTAAAFQEKSFFAIGVSVLVLLGWTVIAYRWAYAWFCRYIISKIGAEGCARI